ncbi:MAG: hypothetical protein Q8O09_00425 [Bacillota bacterium]|nr:hypothetical protein [Bacillota bacterium]
MAKTVNTTKGIKETSMSDKDMDMISARAGEILGKSKKATVHIPHSEGKYEDETVECCINGYNYIIKRGRTVKVPLPILEILKNAHII